MLYDCTCQTSYDNTINWLSQINMHSNINAPKILVANKIDLEEDRVISKEQGLAMANKYNILYAETSAFDGTGVDKLFNGIASTIVKQLI